jgi:hypothetical protein
MSARSLSILALAAVAFALWYFFGRSVSSEELEAATAEAVRCDAQSTCVVVQGSCGYEIAVNARKADAYTGLVARHDHMRACNMAGEIGIPGPFVASCEQARCTMSPAQSGGGRSQPGSALRSYGK